MKYTKEIWYDMSYRERQIYHIYEAFQKRTNKRGQTQKWLPQANSKGFYDYERDGKYPGDKIREAKNWKYFEDVYEEYEDDQLFDPEIFMDAIFRRLAKKDHIFPAQLRTKINRDYYKDYRMKLRMTSNTTKEKEMMGDIINTYKFIRRRLNKEELTFQDLNKFFNNTEDNIIVSDGLFCCIHEMISPFYYVVSKSFQTAYNNSDIDIQEEIITQEEYNHLRGLVKIKTRVYEFIKKVFKEDII